MAHEINNPLEGVTNLLYLAERSEDFQEARKYLADADIELQRVSAITNQTLKFHKQSTKPTEMDAHAMIDSVLAIYNSRLTNSRFKLQKLIRCARSVLCFETAVGEANTLLGNEPLNSCEPTPTKYEIRLTQFHRY